MAMVMQQLERCIHMAYYHRQLLTEQPFAGVAVGTTALDEAACV